MTILSGNIPVCMSPMVSNLHELSIVTNDRIGLYPYWDSVRLLLWGKQQWCLFCEERLSALLSW